VKKLLFVFGTRPEAIKMAPLIKEALKYFNVEICTTGQHIEMLEQVMNFFQLKADYELRLMKSNQTLFDITTIGLNLLHDVLEKSKPDLVLVQGDTTTAFIGALGAFYKKIPVAHIEAGLRSSDKYSPFPEEMNRKMVGSLADYHFAPTQKAVDNLKAESITDRVFLTGNTVIDALLYAVDKVRQDESFNTFFNYLDLSKKIILITCHRRESFGKTFENICDALAALANEYKNVQFVYPVHLNPNIRTVAHERLSGINNVHLIEPLSYPQLVWLMDRSYFIITDSGGIQEEGPSLGKPVLVIRDVTEREEGIEAGTALLVGTSKENIIKEAKALMNDARKYDQMSKAVNPYGDGKSAEKILHIINSPS
jgi:UDP-N-acetylglucosamine 2-epimerase (non-hydrolysing)